MRCCLFCRTLRCSCQGGQRGSRSCPALLRHHRGHQGPQGALVRGFASPCRGRCLITVCERRAGMPRWRRSPLRAGSRARTTATGVRLCCLSEALWSQPGQQCSRAKPRNAPAGTIMSYALDSNDTDELQRQADFNHFSIHDPTAIQVCKDFPVRPSPTAPGVCSYAWLQC